VSGDTVLGIHQFAPHVWGTVGQWVSAVGTVSAFTATFYVIRRDASVRREAQASKVAVYRERAEMINPPNDRSRYRVVIHNVSDQPLYDVVLWLVRDGKLVDSVTRDDVVMPDETTSYLAGDETVFEVTDATFRDNSGRVWRRDIEGRLTSIDPRKTWISFYRDFHQPIRWHLQWPIRKSRQTRRSNDEAFTS
jgi:hypothetical protein